MPLSEGYRYCLTFIDRFTRWPEAVPIKDVTADTVVNAFFSGWISRFGAPSTITSDRGSQFESRLFEALTQLIGCTRNRTTTYHPASNGMVERWHRSLKAAIMCHSTNNWTKILPVVLLGLRTSLKDDIKASAAEMLYGATLRLPGEYFIDEEANPDPQEFIEQFRVFMREVRSAPSAHHNKTKAFSHGTLFSCTHVFIRVDSVKKPLEQPYRGPYEVIDRLSEFVFKINIDGNPTTISTERLKPAFIENNSAVTVTTPRTTTSVTPLTQNQKERNRVTFVNLAPHSSHSRGAHVAT